MTYLHLLRPWWLLGYIPWLLLLWLYCKSNTELYAWDKVCDAHLLPYIIKKLLQSRIS